MSNSALIARSKKYFESDEDKEEVFVVRADYMGFEREDEAQDHANAESGSRDNYVRVTPDHCDLFDALEDAESTGDCDTELTNSTLEDDYAAELTNERKAVITEADRVSDKIDMVNAITVMNTDAWDDILPALKYGETNQDVLDAIDARIAALND